MGRSIIPFDEVWEKIGHLRYSNKVHCCVLYELASKSLNVLELGFGYGKTVCFMAAAGAYVDCVDLVDQRWQEPSIETNLDILGLRDKVNIIRENISYNWWLINRNPDALQYDVIFLDGAHNVYQDTGAFYLSEQLLRPGGYYVIDDLAWRHDGAMDGRFVWGLDTERMSKEERETPHMRLIWENCIKTHPHLYDFQNIDGWLAIARKR